MIDVTAWAPPRRANEGAHGCGRRPSRADLTPIDPKAIADWQARQDHAHDAYTECPNWGARFAHNRETA